MVAPLPDGSLPPGARLLHIGPHKTGTTQVQAAFHANRERLSRLGVHYVGNRRQPMQAAMGAASASVRAGQRYPDRLAKWERLREEIDAADAPRLVLSSEFFADADDDSLRRTVAELDTSRLHVVVTLRPLARILPSQWQQYVQNRLTAGYGAWLNAMWRKPPYRRPTPSFWRRHRHDRLVQRWIDAVGLDAVTVLVADEADPTMLVREFERLVGVEPETLSAPRERSNRSLTRVEVDVMLAFNRLFKKEKLPNELYQRFVRFGAARYLAEREPAADEPPIVTPEWALRRAGDLGTEMADGLRASGVRVVGDLSALASADGPIGPPTAVLDPVTAEIAARLAVGIAAMVDERGMPAADQSVADITRLLADRAWVRLRRPGRRRLMRR